jgi:hypothetical protein
MGILRATRPPVPEAPLIARISFLLVIALVALVACDRGGGDEPSGTAGTFTNEPTASEAPPVTTTTAEPTASPTPPALPATPPPTSGAPSASCADGWVTPDEGSPERTTPIAVIRRTAPFQGDAVVVDMRMFVGPESPPSDKGYLSGIRRWYVKLYAEDELAYQGRFLVEQRRFGRGVAAVAPYDSEGFTSPDWIGFQWESGASPERYAGLPGEWTGIPYDFVDGGAGLTIPGLPEELRGCLEGA